MYQVGLTGGIGSGKTLVCSVLEKLGVPVYYADVEARRLMNEDQAVLKQIVELFGRETYRGGFLDRTFLAQRVFGYPEMLAKLNAIVHPAVRNDYSRWVGRQYDAPYVVEEAAILFESGANRFFDRSVLVYAPEALRISRVMLRDRVEEKEVRRRMMHQMDEKKMKKMKKMADDIIINDGKEMLLPQIIRIHQEILNIN